MLEFKRNLAETVERMRRFWSLGEPLDRVPALVTLPGDPERRADGSFFGRLDAYIASQERWLSLQSRVADDAIPVVCPQYGHALIAALCGAEIVGEAETVWARACIDDLGQAESLALHWDNEWGQRFLEDLARLGQWAEGRCAVANYEIEGVTDTLAALRGTQRMLLDAHESPGGLARLAGRVTDVLVEFGLWSCRHIGAEQSLLGGETVDWRVWMPRHSMCFAEDATVMMSPEFYRRHFQAHDRRLAGAFGSTLLEVHHEGEHQTEPFGEVTGVSALTVESLSRMRPEHRERLQQLVGRKCFLVHARADEVDDVLGFTGVRGVMLSLSAPDAQAANALLGEVERATQRARRQAP